MKVPNENMTKIEREIFDKVRDNLTEDLLPKNYRDKKIPHKMYGHCYHASKVMYKLLGGKDKGYRLKCGIDSDNITHYWIEIDERIIDPTVEQYTDLGRKPPYDTPKRHCEYRDTKAVKTLEQRLK